MTSTIEKYYEQIDKLVVVLIEDGKKLSDYKLLVPSEEIGSGVNFVRTVGGVISYEYSDVYELTLVAR